MSVVVSAAAEHSEDEYDTGRKPSVIEGSSGRVSAAVEQRALDEYDEVDNHLSQRISSRVLGFFGFAYITGIVGVVVSWTVMQVRDTSELLGAKAYARDKRVCAYPPRFPITCVSWCTKNTLGRGCILYAPLDVRSFLASSRLQ